jgi:hypothetical protein
MAVSFNKLLGRGMLLGVVFSLIFSFISCGLFVTEHKVRVKNEYFETLPDFRIGAVEYGDVANKAITPYKVVKPGTHTVSSGITASGKCFKGSITILGKGKHKWTLVVTSDGGCKLEKE